MSGRRVLALYAALLFGFAGVLCRLFYLASRTDYAARAAAQSTVTLELPARRGGFYDCMGLPLTGLEKRWLALCFPGQENYTRLYACTDTAGQELLYRSRSRAAPFLVEVDRDMTALGIPCYAASRRYAAAPLCPQLLGYLDGEGHGAAGLEKALDALLTGSGARDTLLCPVTAQGTLRTGEQVQHLQADSGAVGVRLTLSRSVQRAAEAVAAQTMTTGCILVLDVRTAALRACVSVPGFDPADPAASLEAPDSPFLNRALQAYAVGSVFKPVLAAAALEAGLAPEYDCNGAVVVDGQIFRCAGGVPHGEVTFRPHWQRAATAILSGWGSSWEHRLFCSRRRRWVSGGASGWRRALPPRAEPCREPRNWPRAGSWPISASGRAACWQRRCKWPP